MRNDNDEWKPVEHSGDYSGWFVGIIVALALLTIGYLVFSANADAAQPKTLHEYCSKSEAMANGGICVTRVVNVD